MSQAIHFVPFEKQAQLLYAVLDEETTVICYGGGIRGGKTIGALAASNIYLKRWKGAKAVVVRSTRDRLKKNTLPVYAKVPGRKRVIKENKTDLVYTYAYKSDTGYHSQMIFFSENYAQDPELNRWKGFEYNLIVGEEVNELQEATFDKMLERCGTWSIPGAKQQPPRKVILTFNPSAGWVKDRIFDKWRNGTLPKGWVYIPALPTDNPHLPPGQLEWWKDNLPDREYQVFVLGNWDRLKAEGLFAEEFDEKKHVKPVTFSPAHDVYLSFDFNIANTCLLRQNVGGKRRIVKEYHFPGNLDAFCLKIRDDLKAMGHRGRIYITGDASGNAGSSTYNEGNYAIIRNVFGLQWTAFRVPAVNPTHFFSATHTNVALKHGDWEIDPSCKGLINDFKKVTLLQNRKPVQINKKDPKLTHWLDCFRYSVNAYDQKLLKDLGLATNEHTFSNK